MNRDDVKRAIARLRTLNRNAAAEAAKDYAMQLLPSAARYNTPADLAALATLSVALYYAAATRITGDHGVARLCALIEQRYRALRDGAPVEDVLRAGVDYPEELETHLRTITQLPRLLVLIGMEEVRQVVLPLLL